MHSPWNQARHARKRSQRAVVPRLEILEERRLLSATQDDPIAEPLALVGGAEFQVNTTTAGDQTSPRVTAFADGSFAVIWNHNAYPTFQRYDAAGNPVGSETQTLWTKGYAAVAADGTSIVAYDSGTELRARRHDASGNTVGGSFIVNTLPLSGTSGVKVYTDNDGNHTFIWHGSTTNPEMIFYRRFDSAGTPVTDQIEVSELLNDYQSIYTDSNPAGDLLIAYGARITLVKGAGETIHTSVSGEPHMGDVSIESIDLTREGSFAIRYLVNGFYNYVQRFDSTGLADGEPVDVRFLPTSHGQVVLEPGGDFLLVTFGGTRHEPGAGRGIIAQRFDANGTVETDFLVNTYVVGDQRYPNATMLDSSTFVVAWQSAAQDGSGQGIFAKRFTDDDFPTVELVSPEEGPAFTQGETLLSQVNGLRVTFARPMNEASVVSVANWQLMEGGFDVSNLIASVAYVGDVAYVTLTAPLRGTGYELIVSDSIQDSLGRALDGDDNGTAGGNYSISFSVRQGFFGIGPERMTIRAYGADAVGIDDNGGFAISYSNSGFSAPPTSEVRLFDTTGHQIAPAIGLNTTPVALIPVADGQYLARVSGGVQRFDAGGADPLTPLAANFASLLVYTPVALQHDGTFLVAGTKRINNQGNDYDVHFQRFDADGTPLGPATPVHPPMPGWQDGPVIGIADDGQFVIAWLNTPENGPGYSIHARRYAADATPIGNIVDIATGEGYPTGFDMAMDSAGSFTTVWGDFLLTPGYERRVFTRRYDNDANPLSDTIPLRSSFTEDSFHPDIAMDDSGRTIIVWNEDKNVMVQAFDASGVSFGDAVIMNSLPSHDQSFPFVAMNGAGEAVVTWTTVLNGYTDIRARRLSLGAFPVLDLNGVAEGIDFAADKDPGELLLPIVDAEELTITTSSPTLVGATIQMDPSLIGGELSVNTSGTNITATYSASGVTLSGIDSVANYQQVLRTVVFAPPYSFEGGETTEIEFTIDDGSATSPIATARVRNTAPAEVLGRHLYYAGAKYDDPLPGPHYSNVAYDVSKAAYQAGSGASTFANVSSYTRGINGVVLFTNGDYGVPSLSDFTFKMGTSTNPGTWIDAPAPSAITFREGAGVGGTDILEITWPDGAIKNTWLEVTMLANENTGLAADDVFYFGSRVGDTGLSNSPNAAITSAADQLAVRANPTVGVGVDNPYDFDRNGVVSAGDELTARFNPGVLLMLNLPAPASPSAAEPLAFAEPSPAPLQLAGRADRNALASAPQRTAVGEIPQPVFIAFEPAAPSVPSQRLAPAAVAIVLANDEGLTLETDEPAAEEATGEGLLEMLDSL